MMHVTDGLALMMGGSNDDKVSNFEWILNLKINLTTLDFVFLDFKFWLAFN
jgi:hypothetical protein